jgi:hypothetical protein
VIHGVLHVFKELERSFGELETTGLRQGKSMKGGASDSSVEELLRRVQNEITISG